MKLNCHTAKDYDPDSQKKAFCPLFILLILHIPLRCQRLKNTTPMHLCGPYSNVKVSKTCNYGGIKPQLLNDCHRTLLADLIFGGFQGGCRGDGDSGGGGGCGRAVQMKKSDL